MRPLGRYGTDGCLESACPYSYASYWIFKILFKKLIVDTEQEDKDHDQGQSIGQITAHPVVDF